MHKNTKLTPTLRKEIYTIWCNRIHSVRNIATQYHVDKNVIRTVLLRGRLGDFTVHDSVNYRYRTIEYGLKRLSVTEREVEKQILKQKKRSIRYEKAIPGEMVHGDTKRLPAILKPMRYRQIQSPSEVLFVSIDDHSRWLTADILPDKSMWSSSIFLETTVLRTPFPVTCHYSDNGGEYRGNNTHAFVSICAKLGIEQRFTKPKHPWTNGKAERVIKTILNEWYRKNKGTFTNAEQRRQSLYAYVNYYNHHRPHQSLGSSTPAQRLASYYERSGDNA